MVVNEVESTNWTTHSSNPKTNISPLLIERRERR